VNGVNKLKERIPLLLSQARTRATDPKAAEVSLRAAERVLISARRSDPQWHWMWNYAARDIAEVWYSITADPDKAEGCLQHALVVQGKGTSAWIEMASSLRIALGARWRDRTWDGRTRKYLLRAEGSAIDCRDWCACASAWFSESDDRERALSCLHKAESKASSFRDFIVCAGVWKCHQEYGDMKVKYWTAKASERAVTFWHWLMCADMVAEADELATSRYLAAAEERAGSFVGYALCALASDQHLGARGFTGVMRCLALAERAIRNREEVRRLLVAAFWLRHRAEHDHEPVVGVANREGFEAYCDRCWESFLDIRPQTEDWLALLKGLHWRNADATKADFLLRAEGAARSALDWSKCADGWMLSKLPDARKNAAICRLKSLRKEMELNRENPRHW
jgi:hypothetical protein